MKPAQITRVLEFDAGHRVLGHESKCAHLHGHRYRAEITVEAPKLDSLGRVIDFSVIKTLVGGWIDYQWDHNMILHQDDPLLLTYNYPRVVLSHQKNVKTADIWKEKSPFVMPDALNPTAENMAEILYTAALMLLLKEEITVVNVRLYETPNCWADYGENE